MLIMRGGAELSINAVNTDFLIKFNERVIPPSIVNVVPVT